LKTPLAAREMSQLPVPSEAALAHSRALRQHIAREIGLAGGWISFARYMDLALYAPGLGYYSAGARKFGQAGDFVTAPEISSLFGQCLAHQIAQVLTESDGDVLELGPGSGKLACDVLRALDALGQLPQRYSLLEVSADLRERQRQSLGKLPAHLATRAHWLDTLPASFNGVVIANEVLDVLPVHVVRFADRKVFERGVETESAQEEIAFSWHDRPLGAGALWDAAQRISATCLGGTPPEDYTTEVCPGAPALVASLSSLLQRGVLIFIDYGFRAAEYYHPGRNQGTLMCHYRHYAHADPFYLPGLQDITAHVDFTGVAEAGRSTGAEVLGYATQGNFLIGCGITDILAANDPMKIADYLPLANQAQRLMSPAEMGEFFKVLALGKGVRVALRGFEFGRPLPL
jgi:SAM-dependent MidA family methyltransferase